MKTYKMLLYLWLAAAFFITSCCTKDNPMEENPTPAELIAGFYEAIKWTDIGVGDWQVDMLARGSSLTAQLTSDLKISGHIFIPTNTGDAFLDFLFLVKGDSLETIDLDGPSGVFKIIMQKK